MKICVTGDTWEDALEEFVEQVKYYGKFINIEFISITKEADEAEYFLAYRKKGYLKQSLFTPIYFKTKHRWFGCCGTTKIIKCYI